MQSQEAVDSDINLDEVKRAGRIKNETDIAGLPTTMISTRASERYHEESWGEDRD